MIDRKISCLPGVTIIKTEDEPHMITITGNNLENVSITYALIHQIVAVKRKNINKPPAIENMQKEGLKEENLKQEIQNDTPPKDLEWEDIVE